MPGRKERGSSADTPARPVTMVRVSSDPYPQFALPAGYSIAWHKPGCEAWWYNIQRQADTLTVISQQTFSQYFGSAPQELAQRQCFLLSPAGAPIGTATAWFDDDYHGERWGRLHWVAILPEWQGRGLGRALVSVVCARLRQFHPHRAYLRTAAERLAAIHLYLSFGFVPEAETPEAARLWEQILATLR